MKNPGESRQEHRKPSERTTEQLRQPELKDISEDDLSIEEAYNQAMAELEQETVSPAERLDEYFTEVPAVAEALPRPEELQANPDALYERELRLRAEYAKFLRALPTDLHLPRYDRLGEYIQGEDEEDKRFSAALPSIKLKNTGLLARDAVANRFNSFVAGAEILAEAAKELKLTRTQKERAA